MFIYIILVVRSKKRRTARTYLRRRPAQRFRLPPRIIKTDEWDYAEAAFNALIIDSALQGPPFRALVPTAS